MDDSVSCSLSVWSRHRCGWRHILFSATHLCGERTLIWAQRGFLVWYLPMKSWGSPQSLSDSEKWGLGGQLASLTSTQYPQLRFVSQKFINYYIKFSFRVACKKNVDRALVIPKCQRTALTAFLNQKEHFEFWDMLWSGSKEFLDISFVKDCSSSAGESWWTPEVDS